MKIKIFTTSHDSKYGTDTDAYGTYKEARAVRYKMAREGWVELMENEPKPSNRDELADKYWEMAGICHPEEYFTIEEHEIDMPMLRRF
jgi:hypothetical protein